MQCNEVYIGKRLLFRMAWNEEILYYHCFSTFYNASLPLQLTIEWTDDIGHCAIRPHSLGHYIPPDPNSPIVVQLGTCNNVKHCGLLGYETIYLVLWVVLNVLEECIISIIRITLTTQHLKDSFSAARISYLILIHWFTCNAMYQFSTAIWICVWE